MRAADAKFTLGIDGCGADIPAAAGEVKTFDVFATLTTTNNTGTDGAQGWSLSISVEGATITKVALKGVTVSTIYEEDDDLDPTTPTIHHDPFDFDLGLAFTTIQGKATFKDDATKLGAISAVIMKSQEKMVLQPTGTQKIFKLSLSATAPATVNIGFVNGYKTITSQPTNNVITFGGKSVAPDVVNCSMKVGAVVAGCTIGKDYGFFFNTVATGEQDLAAATTAKVLMRNKLDVPGFSLGIKKAAGILTFSAGLGSEADRLVDLVIAKSDLTQVTGADLIGNSAKGAPADNISAVARGAALAGFDQIDFWGPDLAPAVGGPGITLGYIVDKNESKKTIPVVVDPAAGGCGSNEIVILTFGGPPPQTKFFRGDGNGDGKINVTDAVIIAQNIFFNAAHFFDCDDMLDVNDDGSKSVADPVFLLNYMFLHGAVPAAPFKACGVDPTADTLLCKVSNCQ